MQNNVGLLNCTITKQFDKCVAVLFGHLNTEDAGPAEVWGYLSENGLLSLREDLLRPEAEPTRTYHVGPGECCVTSQQTDCIHAKVADIPELKEGQPTGRIAQIWACLSLAGIDRLLERLRSAEAPLNLAPVVLARGETPYGWTVVHRDGNIQHQFPFGEAEQPFRVVRLAEVEMLLVEPRDLGGSLPTYRLHRLGFEILRPLQESEMLPLPVPGEPFQFRYYRRVTVVVFGQHGTGEAQKPHIVQVVGWRIERPEGALICELGVEEDGSWTIYRRGRVAAGTDDRVLPMTEEEFAATLAA